MFREINEQEKQKYVDKAEKAKEEYQEKMKTFKYVVCYYQYGFQYCFLTLFNLFLRKTHPDYILPKSKHQTAKAVPPKAPTPFRLFSDAKMETFETDGVPSSQARLDFDNNNHLMNP